MPFGGRPSDACEPCRKGRLRCDRIRPSCTQCLRKSIICFGYRNVGLLLFKDESESTALRVQRERNGVLYPPTIQKQRLEHELLASPNCKAFDIIPTLSRSPTPSHHDLAIGYFMSSYVQASPFNYLPDVFNTLTSTAEDAVSPGILAASFASFSLYASSGELMDYARTHYSKALVRTNVALASPRTAILDSSLISVLLLGLYEAIAFSGRRSPASWTAHTLGAVELIRLRGTRQLGTELGKQLFLQTCNNIRSSCIQRAVPVPGEFLRLYERAEPFLYPRTPNVKIGPLLDKVANFKARVLKGLSAQSRPGVIYEALRLDEEARVLTDMLPESWSYKVRPPYLTPQCAYQGLAHQYPTHRIARHWNILRIIRIFLNEVVWHVSRFVAKAREEGSAEISEHYKDLDTTALQTSATINRTLLVTDILASAPHFLDKNGTTFIPAARFLIWPLTVVWQVGVTLEPARRYAIWCLYEIATQAKIPQALEAAKAVKSGSSVDWMHLYQLG